MPRLESLDVAPGPRIRGFTGTGAFRIDEQVLPAALLTPGGAWGWSPPPLDRLVPDDLASLFDPPPEFILLGTGVVLAQPPASLRAALDGRSIGLEAMDSRAAARLWGVLRGEGRTIAAALYPL